MTTPLISNPSTTIRRYSLFAEAFQREQDARKEWISAGFLNEVENTTTSAVRLIQAAEKLKKAIQDRKSVVRDVFDERATFGTDGTDNTLSGSLRDAGFSDFGPM